MNARIAFVFGLLFTLLNVVMVFTTHSGLMILVIVGLMFMLGSAIRIWGTPADAMREDDYEEHESFLLADEEAHGYTGAND